MTAEQTRKAALAKSLEAQAIAKRENAKHTPGPWAYAWYSKKRFGLGSPGEGAWMFLQTLYVDADHPEMQANARLIASAPELAFHLLAAANYIDALGGDSKSYRAAIAKATGDTP